MEARYNNLKHRASNLFSSKSPQGPIPKNILAFRTITTLLSSLRKADEMKLTCLDQGPHDNMVRQEVKILSALATVLVRNREIVAVVALRNEHPQQGGQEERIQAIACTRNDMDEPNPSPVSSTSPSSLTSSLWKIFTTRNYRRDWDNSNGSLGPGKPIVSIQNLDGSLKNFNSDARIRTFDQHVTIICKMINNSRVNDTQIGVFQDYVVAACSSKILYRLTHAISAPFFDSLIAISESSFKFTDDTKKERERSDRDLCRKLPSLFTLHPEDLPNLFKRCEATVADETYQLYTADTCMEFHWLLCQLLKSFKKHLGTLVSESESPPSASRAAFFGNALWSLARSDAFERHLHVILPQLLEIKSKKGGKDNENDAVEMVPQGDPEDLEEPELRHLQEESEKSLWTSYRDWLRLIVVHFDAVAILHGHVSSTHFPYTGVSIEVIKPEPVTTALLPWDELFMSEHFPTTSQSVFDTSNEEIVKFLKKSTEIAKCMKQNKKLVGNIRRDLQSDPDNRPHPKRLHNVISSLNEHRQDNNIANIISIVESLKLVTEVSRIEAKLCEIIDMLEPDLPFSKALDGILKTGEGFYGVEHCEAQLAAHITLCHSQNGKPNPKLDMLKDAGHIIGVSKPCCPACDHLLQMLSNPSMRPKPFKKFVTRGAHNVVSACSLPIGLPPDIVNHMNMTFGGQLRQQIIRFMAESRTMRNRAESITSDRLSLASLEDQRQLERDDLHDLAVELRDVTVEY